MNDIIRVKFLYRAAMDVLESGQPFAAGMAVSGLQDAVEAMAHEAAALVGANVGPKTFFLEHWEQVAKVSGNAKRLAFKSEMSDLNAARVGFKHQGNSPDIADAEKHALAAHRFLVDTAQVFFAVDFDSLSEADLINGAELRQEIKLAEAALSEGNAEACLRHCRLAMNLVEVLMRVATGVYDPARRSPDVPREAERIMSWAEDRLNEIEVNLALTALRVNPADAQILYDSLPQHSVNKKNFWFRSGVKVTAERARTSLRILLDLGLRAERAKWQLDRLHRQAGSAAEGDARNA
jgi:hypothetical protein